MIDAITIAEGGFSENEDSLENIAARVAEILTKDGYKTTVWAKGGNARVYVKRNLSRRIQDMGYVAIETSGRNYSGLTRQHAGIRDMVEGALK